jgi:purine nucleoside phosphorylase
MEKNSLVVILGSAHDRPQLAGQPLDGPETATTAHGEVALFRYPRADRPAWVLFRHGLPHRRLPNQVPYRAHAAALREVRCGALLATSSVGILDESLPLDTPLLLSDMLMLENRLPDGSACTMFQEPTAGQGHLVVDDGLFSSALSDQIAALLPHEPRRALFAYVGGPRTKTPAENALLRRLGAQVNSMSVGPEVVLANELEIPTAGLVAGHKRSGGAGPALDRAALADTLVRAGGALEQAAARWLEHGSPVPFANQVYRYEATR